MENSYFTDAELTSLRAKICDILGDDEKPLITFEGNIGAGKSTFVKTFIENLGDGLSKKLIEEPLDKWMDLAGENLLAQMYQDPAKTFLFQTYVLVTMLEKGVSDPEGALLISERSIDSAYKIFINMQHANGVLSNSEFNVLTELYKASRKAIAVTSNLVIWIDTPVEKCYANVENRNRQGEGGISKEYLAEVDKYHRSWLEGNDAVKVIRIDGNVSLYELKDKAEKLAHIVIEEL